MTDLHVSTDASSGSDPKPKKRRNPWLRALKWVIGAVLALVLLIVLVVGGAVWILTPAQLTPLVEKYGSEYIDGQVRVSRVELTFWHTFPQLRIDVDSLEVISHSLHKLPESRRRMLPDYADSLMSVRHFHGGVNILKALIGDIALYDIVIDHPKVNLLDVDSVSTNYNILPASTEEPDTSAVSIPDISLTRFRIIGDAPVRYHSMADSLNLQLTLSSTAVSGDNAPGYRLDFSASADAHTGGLRVNNLSIGMGGDIIWNHDSPYKVELRDFQTGVNGVNTVINTSVDFERELTVETLEFLMPLVKVNSIIAIIPPEMRGELARVSNNLKIGMKARLLAPYRPASGKMPSAEVELKIPSGQISYDRLSLDAFELGVKARIDGENPDASVVTLEKLHAIGEGMGFTLKGTADHLFSDPHVKGSFAGGLGFARLPGIIYQKMKCSAGGRLRADAEFDLRQSYLTRENFHRIRLTGEASLDNFRLDMPESPLTAYIRRAELELGTATKFVRGEVSSDSLLTVSFKIDTVAVAMSGLQAEGRGLRLGVGAKNRASSVDTTLINPIGGVIAVERFKMLSTEDSTKIRLRDVTARGSLQRFKGLGRVPQLNMSINAGRVRYSDMLNRASLRNSIIDLTIHPAKPRLSRRVKAAMDSLRHVYPGMRPDSLYNMARRSVPRRRLTSPAGRVDSTAKVDFEIDGETRSLLRRWNASGRVKAERARLLTPYFPLRNILRDVDVSFNNDSVIVRHTRWKVGKTDFTIDGTISNLTRAVTSRHGRQPLRVNFRITSDTIDVNQIAAAVFAGAAFSERYAEGDVQISDSDNDDVVQASIENAADTAATGPLLIPTNIEATLRLSARNLLYADFLFHNFRGSAEVFDGALNLRNLSARTDAGGVDLTALYQGLHPDSLSFAFGMQVRDFRIDRFMSLMPSLDTVMPLLHDIKGIINAEVAATSALSRDMDLRIPSLNAAVNITGDSLVLLDAETFRKIGKWLLFKKKDRNVVDHMDVKLVVKESRMELFPFVFDIDRYRLGVFGNNDMDLNFKYHVAVLKSPIPFKFGINVSGNPDKMKIRLGGAKLNEKNMAQTVAISDTTRINLVNQIESLFRRGVRRAGRNGGIHLDTRNVPASPDMDESPSDTISAADSLVFIREGLIPAPPKPEPVAEPQTKKKKK